MRAFAAAPVPLDDGSLRPGDALHWRGHGLGPLALYALMIVMQLLGWAILSAEGLPVLLSGGTRLPSMEPQRPEL